MTIETLITILTIENLNSWKYLLPENQEWQWTAFAILAIFLDVFFYEHKFSHLLSLQQMPSWRRLRIVFAQTEGGNNFSFIRSVFWKLFFTLNFLLWYFWFFKNCSLPSPALELLELARSLVWAHEPNIIPYISHIFYTSIEKCLNLWQKLPRDKTA